MTQEALGIRVGDIVSTDYGTGPYRVVEVRLRGPGEWVPYLVRLNGLEDRFECDEPAASLVLKRMPWPDTRRTDRDDYYISDIIRRGGRWFSVRVDWKTGLVDPDRPGDEIFAERGDSVIVVEQLEMFA